MYHRTFLEHVWFFLTCTFYSKSISLPVALDLYWGYELDPKFAFWLCVFDWFCVAPNMCDVYFEMGSGEGAQTPAPFWGTSNSIKIGEKLIPAPPPPPPSL